jgi:hypothetical protein
MTGGAAWHRKREFQARFFAPCLEMLEDRTLLSGVSFGAPTAYPVGPTPSCVTVGDFNGDGKLDLAVANSSPNGSTVSILLGNGDGTFQGAQNFSAGGDEGSSVAVGDFDGRHYANGQPILDLAVANYNSVAVLMGNGDGTFQTPKNYPIPSNAVGLTVADFDGDGTPDIAVATGYGVSWLLGNGDGTFRPAQTISFSSFPTSVAAADLNHDGKQDLVVAFEEGFISVLLGNGDGMFQAPRNYSAGGGSNGSAEAYSLKVADFNGDGNLDLAFVDPVYGNAGVFLGNGDGTFQPVRTFSAGANFPESRFLAVGDFNGDGTADLAVANSVDDGTHPVKALLGNGDGSFQTPQNVPFHEQSGFWILPLAVGDFNGDNKPDLVVADSYHNTVSVLLSQLVTATTVSGPANSSYTQPVIYSASVSVGGVPVTTGTVTFEDGSTPVSPAIPLDNNGQASFTIASLSVGSHTITAVYSGMPGGAGTSGLGSSVGTTGMTVANPLPLSATGVNFSAFAGAPFTAAIATFTNPDPFGSAASYTAIITWGDGSTSIGTITGSGTLTVGGGTHAYADPGTYAVRMQISHNLGNTTTATASCTATVTNLGQGVKHGLTGDAGFWHNSSGQALIRSFNGGPSATALSAWLAASFPNLYGASGNNLSGATNDYVASYFQVLFALPNPTVEAQVLATALSVYATTLSLGGTAGQAYGFTVTTTGLGADAYNVGGDGAAFGVASKTTLNVYELLKALDRQAVYGVLYNGDKTLRNDANDLFSALMQAGAIS